MALTTFYIRAIVYLLALLVSFYACQAIHFEVFLKKDHVLQARVLYGLIVIGLAYLVAQFMLGFLYRL